MARLYMVALQFMGAAIAMLIGYGGVAGPGIEEAEPQAALAAIISFSALLLLFVFDFHHEIVKALVQSYTVAPVNVFFNPQAALVDVTDTVSESFMVVHPPRQPVHRLCDPGQSDHRLRQQADAADPGLFHLAALRHRRRADHLLFRHRPRCSACSPTAFRAVDRSETIEDMNATRRIA